MESLSAFTGVRWRSMLLGAAMLLGVTAGARAGDWPAFRRDIARSAVADEKLVFPMRQAWRYTAAQPPSPAWKPTTKSFNQMEFDYAPQPVVAGGLVVFGSSSDDTIRALDLATGAEKWHFVTGAPVRFAPQCVAGRVYAGSDDGVVYCLDAGTGTPIWTFRAAPRDERLLGNNRMISRWPLRNGVLVDGGAVFAVAGMWPSEGVFVYSLDAETGKVNWCNDTAGVIGPWEIPLSGDETYFLGNVLGLAPQGVLLATANELIVPQGQARPARIDRRTGKLLDMGSSKKNVYSSGPPFAMVGSKEFVYSYAASPKGFRESGIKQTVAGTNFSDIPQPSRGDEGIGDPERGLDVALLATKERLYARRGYSIALAGETLIVGEDGCVVAYQSKKSPVPADVKKAPMPARYDVAGELWRFAVNGQARGLAVADGRIVVTTHRGEVYCFTGAPDKATAEQAKTTAHHQPAASFEPPAVSAEAEGCAAQLKQAGVHTGFALLAGDSRGDLAIGLAARTALHVVSVVKDEATASRLRETLLTKTAWHGGRVHVFAVGEGGRLPFAKYFANAVIVAEPGVVSASELYRVLRPAGGVLFCVGPSMRDEHRAELIRSCGAGEGEIKEASGALGLRVVRRPLAGALDWNANTLADRHLRGPLRPLWFGGPDPMRFIERGTPILSGMIAANGRFFQMLDGEIVATDAYNGRDLWRRYIPRELRPAPIAGEPRLIAVPPFSREASSAYTTWRVAPTAVRGFTADGESVYLTLGETCTAGRGNLCIRLDAATGETRALFGAPAPLQTVPLKEPQSWPLKIDAKHSGQLTLAADEQGLTLTLTTTDPAVTADDAWNLFFDFRPAAQRFGLHGRGTFQVRVQPAPTPQGPAAYRIIRQASAPEFSVTGSRTAEGTTATVKLSWAQVQAFTGGRPATFGFAATLFNSDSPNPTHNSVELSKNTAYLFCDAFADALNNGWATAVVGEAGKELDTLKSPAILAGTLDAVPEKQRGMRSVKGYFNPDEETSKQTRIHPFTGDPVPKSFSRGNGCGVVYSSAYVNYMRSGTLGIFDLLDDSGIRHYGGIRPSCGMNMLAALGVLFVSEDSSGCGCQYSYDVPIAFADAEQRLNEDWATFSDIAPQSQLRSAAINFGAPGDRRDARGTLWLNFPRFAGFDVPMKIEALKGPAGLGPYRVNADRVAIRNTDRPWLYSSQYRGLSKATIKLEFREPIVSLTAAQAGKSETPQRQLPVTKTHITVSHDTGALRVFARRAAIIDRTGKQLPWLAKTKGEDAAVWNDDSFELFLSDRTGNAVVHLGIAASGAKFEALARAGEEAEDVKWKGEWRGVCAAETESLAFEFVIPFKTLSDAGIDVQSLALNAQANQQGGPRLPTKPDPLSTLGGRGRSRCGNFIPVGLGQPPSMPPRAFTVRLHFAELEDAAPGQRVFDVKLQGQTVAQSVDVVKEAGGARTALIKEFRQISAADLMTLELVPSSDQVTPANAPILNALEVLDESFRLPARKPAAE